MIEFVAHLLLVISFTTIVHAYSRYSSITSWRTTLRMQSTVPKNSLLSKVDIQSLVKQTALLDKPLTRIYTASKDGWDASAFHRKVDFNPPVPSLVIMKTKSGGVSGCFNPLGWQSRDDYRDSRNCFLYKVTKSGNIEKSTKIGGSGAALYDFGDRAIWFAEALNIPMNPKYLPNKTAKSNLGTSYSTLSESGEGSVFFEGKGGRGEFGTAQLVELEVYTAEAYVRESVNMYSRSRGEGSGDSRDNSASSSSTSGSKLTSSGKSPLRKLEEFLFGEEY
mmetsp:Transcript_13750/g.22917  ORF Transcript_13750/g.22917 Transcript_13750/m.22917 type:complete len:278 (-) Transcript_13750:1129-1962(-)